MRSKSHLGAYAITLVAAPSLQPPRRRWFRFGLRGLMVATVILGLAFAPIGWEFSRLRRQQQAIDRVVQLQGIAVLDNGIPDRDRTTDGFLGLGAMHVWFDSHPPAAAARLRAVRWLLGNDTLAYVDYVHFRRPSIESQDDDFKKLLAEFPRVRAVVVEYPPVSDSVIDTVARLPQLEYLDLLDPSALSPRGYQQLGSITTLKSLELRGRLNNDALHHLARLEQLEDLYLWGTNLDNQGLKHLSQLPRLKALSVVGTPITDDNMPHLARLRSLRYLRLNDTSVTDAGLDHLTVLPELQTLLLGLPITPAAARRLHSSLPDHCQIFLFQNDGSVLRIP